MSYIIKLRGPLIVKSILNRRHKTLIIFFLLLLGLFVYYLFGKETYISKILNDIIQIQVDTPNTKFLTIVRNYLPDFVWTMAFGLSLSLFTSNLLVSFITPVIIGVGLEIAELFNLISGSFDIYDIFIEILASTFVWIILKRGKKDEK